MFVERGTLRNPCVERIVANFVLTQAGHKIYSVTQTVVFTEFHFRIEVTYGDTQRVFTLIGTQKGIERDRVGDLRVVWFG